MTADIIPFDPLAFRPFGKIARLTRQMVITEKLDGTNAQVMIAKIGSDDLDSIRENAVALRIFSDHADYGYAIFAGSRSRWVKPGKATDNHGFAAWVHDHADELIEGLGEGRHFGEWWGQGINRGYGLQEKRFSLFNTSRWVPRELEEYELKDGEAFCPPCCDVVPILYAGEFCTGEVEEALDFLADNGSLAAEPFDRPEGVVIYHVASGYYFKKTLDNDAAPKSIANAGIVDEPPSASMLVRVAA